MRFEVILGDWKDEDNIDLVLETDLDTRAAVWSLHILAGAIKAKTYPPEGRMLQRAKARRGVAATVRDLENVYTYIA